MHADTSVTLPSSICTSCAATLSAAPRSSAVAFIAVVINSAFAVSLAGFLVMHANMLAANCTTIEMYEKERIHPWPYNKGFKRNFEEVFGKRWGRRVPILVLMGSRTCHCAMQC